MGSKIKYMQNIKSKQKGVVLFVALMMLLVLIIASVGIARNIDSSTVIANNISFGKSNIMAGDWALEQGNLWLNANANVLESNNTGGGYFSTTNGSVTALSDKDWFQEVNWNNAKNLDTTAATAPKGYTIHMIINRLCLEAGPVNGVSATQQCVRSTSKDPGSIGTTAADIGGDIGISLGESESNGGSAAGGPSYTAPGNVYYRITVRVRGPRNSVNYLQSTVSISTV